VSVRVSTSLSVLAAVLGYVVVCDWIVGDRIYLDLIVRDHVFLDWHVCDGVRDRVERISGAVAVVILVHCQSVCGVWPSFEPAHSTYDLFVTRFLKNLILLLLFFQISMHKSLFLLLFGSDSNSLCY